MSEIIVRTGVPEVFAAIAACEQWRQRLVNQAIAIRLAGGVPDEEATLIIGRLRTFENTLRDALEVPVTLRERARHDHEEDERDDWSPRSAYFDGEYREPVVHRDDSQGYRDAMVDAGRGELLRG